MGIQIYESHATLPEHPAPFMRVLCHVRGLGQSCTSKQIFFFSYSFDSGSEAYESKERHL